MVIDGVFDRDAYNQAPVKIVWVLKEALEYEQNRQSDLLKDALEKKQLGPTWTTIAYVAYAIINGWESGNFTKWEDIPTVKAGVGDVLYKIALINANKGLNQASSGLSNNSVILNAYQRYADMIERQIRDLNPDIVVFGYPEALKGIVQDVFLRMTGQEYKIDEHFGTFAATVRDNQLFIWAYHPSIYRSEENGQLSKYCYYESFIESVKLFKQKLGKL